MSSDIHSAHLSLPIHNFSSLSSGKTMSTEAWASHTKFKIRHRCQDNQKLSSSTVLLKTVRSWAPTQQLCTLEYDFHPVLDSSRFKSIPNASDQGSLKIKLHPWPGRTRYLQRGNFKIKTFNTHTIFWMHFLLKSSLLPGMSVNHVYVWCMQKSGQSRHISLDHRDTLSSHSKSYTGRPGCHSWLQLRATLFVRPPEDNGLQRHFSTGRLRSPWVFKGSTPRTPKTEGGQTFAKVFPMPTSSLEI